MDYENKVEPIG